MNKLAIVNNISRTFHKVGFQFKKHSPEILIATGVIGAVASTVIACKATTKLSGILEESKHDVNELHKYVETKGFSEEYTEHDSKKDITIIYTKTGLKLVKLYAPAVILGAASLGCILTSHNIIRKRNVALAAAYATIDKSFKDYRSRVVERFGEDLDKELKYNVKTKEIEETVVDEKGKEKKAKTTIDVGQPSGYARFFDVGNPFWEKDSEYNLMFLNRQQNYANDKLRAQGYLFLNDVYEMVGIRKTRAGQQVGWIYDEKHPIGDNYVDFGIYDIHDEAKRDFVNGRERTILLDFNVDGPILDRLP